MTDTIPASFAIAYGSTDSFDHTIDTNRTLGSAIINETSSTFLEIRGSESQSSGEDTHLNHSDEDGVFKCWMILLFAILLEVAGTTSMKISDEFTKLAPSVMIYVFYGLSFYVFPLSLKRIDLSTSYAVWSGLGTVLTCLVGFLCFSDTMNMRKAIALTTIIVGCIALKFADWVTIYKNPILGLKDHKQYTFLSSIKWITASDQSLSLPWCSFGTETFTI